MPEIKEVYEKKTIYHGEESPRTEETHIVREGSHVDHVIHEDHHDHLHPSTEPRAGEDRHDYRSRREVRGQIVGFRRGAYLILDIIEAILIAEFFVKLFGLNPLNPLVALIDMLSYPLYAPFAGLMTTITPYFIINWSLLVAMVVYALLVYIVVALFASGVRASYRHH